LVARGHTVTVVCGAHAQAGLELPFDSAQGWRRGLVDGIDVISLPLPYANRDGVARRTWTFLRFAARSVRLALTLEADLVFATSTPLTAALPGLAAQAARGLPFVFEVRDLWPSACGIPSCSAAWKSSRRPPTVPPTPSSGSPRASSAGSAASRPLASAWS
jgi:hypothetical protein